MAKPATILEHACDFFATGFYSGRLPVAPGTWGSAAAMLLAWLMAQSGMVFNSISLMVLVAVAVTLLGILTANVVCRRGFYGERRQDPGEIVIDEFAGYFVSIIGTQGTVTELLIAFFLFRIFDIAKPWPVRNLEKYPDGYGIMLDDVMAGVYALIGTHAVIVLLL